MKTYQPAAGEIERKWWHIDATGTPLGRLATRVATILRGKHKPQFTPHLDVGDFVVVTNLMKVTLTGKKWDKKIYHRHTGFPGGVKSVIASEMRDRRPERLLMLAVKNMLPKNRLGRALLTKLKVYPNAAHPHSAQFSKEN